MNSFIILQDGVSLSIGMKPYSVDVSHPNYSKIVDALKEGDFERVEGLINIAKSLVGFCGERISVDVDNGIVSYGDEELHSTLTNRILTMMREGFDVQPLVNFLDNLMQNPSKRAVDELYGFLEHGKMPITPDGHFLAYKRVNANYTSVHDGKTDNGIGKIVSMARNKVDENSQQTCSYGLHFCSHEYLKSFSGAKVVVLKINPRDVVAIPVDYNNTKGRACSYEVVGELSPEEVTKALGGDYFDASVNDDFDDRDVYGDEDAMEDILGMARADRDFDDGNLAAHAVGNDKPFARKEMVASQDYVAGYHNGYSDGRRQEPQTYFGGGFSEYSDGFAHGYKDGKGHKSKPKFIIS